MAPDNMNFFPILAGTCRGTGIFAILTHRARTARALLHLASLAFFAALMCATCEWFRLEEKFGRITGFIQEKTGGISVTESGIKPVIEPNKAKYYLVFPDLEFKYTPDIQVQASDINVDTDTTKGIIWTPGIVALWVRNADGLFGFTPVIWATSKGTFPKVLYNSMTPVSKESLVNKLSKSGNPNGPFSLRPKNSNIKEMFTPLFVLVASFLLYIVYFLQIVFQTLFFALIFSMIFGFTGRRNARTLPFNRLLAIVIYASFPPIIIGSIFSALDLPIDYQTVFLFCYVCYLMAVMLRVERTLTPDIDKPEL